MTTPSELTALDGCAQAELLRQRRVTARELIDAAIARIESINPHINAVTAQCFDQARAGAEQLELQSRTRPGPLTGVPFLVKDLGPAVEGMPMTAGSRLLSGVMSRYESEIIRRFRSAGLALLGKTNTAELGVLPTTEPVFGGATLNPWDRSRSPGGSSGGAAAAVASGMVPVAHANDAGGSIRIPAACCGVFGLKPTRARTPMGPAVGDLMSGLAVEFVVTRSVRDSAALLDSLSGPDIGDPYCAPTFDGSYLREIAERPRAPLDIAVDLRPARIASLHADCVAGLQASIAACQELGHRVHDVRFPIEMTALHEDFLTLWAAGVSSAIEAHAAMSGRKPSREVLEPLTFWLYERGRSISSAAYLLAVTRLQRASRTIAQLHEKHAIWLSPVTSTPAPPLGEFAHGSPSEQLARALAFVFETPIANFTGQPAMSVPLHRTATGLPVGVQFTGRFGDEVGLLRLAADLERARPWPSCSEVPSSGFRNNPHISSGLEQYGGTP